MIQTRKLFDYTFIMEIAAQPKQKIHRKTIIKQIEQKLTEGKTRQEIFEELRQQYKREDLVARFVAMFPDKELKIKYQGANTALFVLLVISAVLKFLVGILLMASINPSLAFLALLFPFINVVFAYDVYKQRGY